MSPHLESLWLWDERKPGAALLFFMGSSRRNVLHSIEKTHWTLMCWEWRLNRTQKLSSLSDRYHDVSALTELYSMLYVMLGKCIDHHDSFVALKLLTCVIPKHIKQPALCTSWRKHQILPTGSRKWAVPSCYIRRVYKSWAEENVKVTKMSSCWRDVMQKIQQQK